MKERSARRLAEVDLFIEQRDKMETSIPTFLIKSIFYDYSVGLKPQTHHTFSSLLRHSHLLADEKNINLFFRMGIHRSSIHDSVEYGGGFIAKISSRKN